MADLTSSKLAGNSNTANGPLQPPVDATVWAVPVKSLSTSKTPTPTETAYAPSPRAATRDLSAALSDTFDNILGLINQKETPAAPPGSSAPLAPPPPEAGKQPPSAASINRALRAVLVAAEQTAGAPQKARPPPSLH